MADFGLAKNIYTCEYYRSNQHGALPVKWMSPESLLDNFFDEKSDVVCLQLYKTSQQIRIKSDNNGNQLV